METIEQTLAHFGVKGMKWGVHRERAAAGNKRSQRKLKRGDKRFARKADDPFFAAKVYNEAVKITNKNHVDRINNKPQYKDKDFSRDTPLRRKYYKEHKDAFLSELEKAAASRGLSPSGTKKFGVMEGTNNDWRIIVRDVTAHADDEGFLVKIEYDDKGYIVKMVVEDESLMQAEDDVDAVLAHFGVKGMKWGQRLRSSRGTPSEDHTRSREIKKKGRGIGGTKKLSNEELKSLIERMNLEQQLSDLKKKKGAGEGSKIAKEIILDVGKQTAKEYLKKNAGKLILGLIKR